ncbi:unnamed protein product [Danaus chrysippus]|uniref:(African queen) hypothetical protein n=1 Tax=Danaus chrysippus TaxID=151541 RepID=A0A8J2VUR4_9NEOP|nr:unnamed protein product [Danaus chrysippus]
MGGCCSLEDSSSDSYTGYSRQIITPVAEPTRRQAQFIATRRQPQFIATPRQPQFKATPRQPQFKATPRQPQFKVTPRQPQPRPKPEIDESQFGEFRCTLCGRSWKSLRCWPNKYQMCKNCKKPVYPTNCRETHSSDFTSDTDDAKEHERDLCQMCQQLGYSCRNFRRAKRIF